MIADHVASYDTAAYSEDVRRVARALAEAYTYPVDSIVVTPDGEVLAEGAANEMGFGAYGYLKLLEDGLEGFAPAEGQ